MLLLTAPHSRSVDPAILKCMQTVDPSSSCHDKSCFTHWRPSSTSCLIWGPFDLWEEHYLHWWPERCCLEMVSTTLAALCSFNGKLNLLFPITGIVVLLLCLRLLWTCATVCFCVGRDVSVNTGFTSELSLVFTFLDEDYVAMLKVNLLPTIFVRVAWISQHVGRSS